MLELLIALTLLGLILVLLFSGFRLATRSWEAGEERFAETGQQGVIVSLLRRQLSEARPLSYQDPQRGRTLLFEGGEKAVRFVAPLMTRLGRGGLYEIRLRVVQGDQSKELRMGWRPFRPKRKADRSARLREAKQPFEERVLYDGLKSARFGYFGTTQPGEEPVWKARWQEANQLPQGLRLQIQTESGKWPKLTVALAGRVSRSSGGGGLGMGP